jgi:hypothetical protein
VGNGSVIRRGLELLGREWRYLALLAICLDLPPILGEAVTVGGGILPAEMAAPVWALFALVLLPLSHGGTLLLLQGRYDHQPIRLRDALRGGVAVWGKYQVAYLYMSFLILGWAAVFLIPGLILMMLTGIKQVWVLAPFGVMGVAYGILPLVFQEPFFVTQGMTPWEARLRSRELVKGRWGAILKLALVTMALPMVFEYGADLMLGLLDIESGPVAILLKAAFGTMAAFLYIVPAAVFYVLFRDLTSQGAEALAKPPGNS